MIPQQKQVSGKEHGRYKHGMFGTRIYNVWTRMKSRCFDPTNKSYARYGGRGIRVSANWLTFEGFYKDMGASYKHGLTIERIDNDGWYSRANCKWIPANQQARNKSTVALYLYKGEKLNIPEIAKKIGIKNKTLYARIKILKWPLEKAFTK